MSRVLAGPEAVATTGRVTAARAGRRRVSNRRLLSRKWRRALHGLRTHSCCCRSALTLCSWSSHGCRQSSSRSITGTASALRRRRVCPTMRRVFEGLTVTGGSRPLLRADALLLRDPDGDQHFLAALITGPRRPPWTFTRAVLFLPQVLPPVAVAVMWQWMYSNRASLTKSWAGSALAASLSRGWLASHGLSRRSGSSVPGSRWACAWRSSSPAPSAYRLNSTRPSPQTEAGASASSAG